MFVPSIKIHPIQSAFCLNTGAMFRVGFVSSVFISCVVVVLLVSSGRCGVSTRSAMIWKSSFSFCCMLIVCTILNTATARTADNRRDKIMLISMFLSLFSIYEGWRKPSALALYDHPNKLEFVYLSNLQISTLKRYLLTHSPFSIGQQRFPALRN